MSNFLNSSSSSTISKVDEWSKSFFCCMMKSSRFSKLSSSFSILIGLLIIPVFFSFSMMVIFLSSLKCSLPIGNSTMNELPFPTSLSTVICPWCAFTILSDSDKPIPVPVLDSSLFTELFTWKKRSKIRSVMSLGIPMPESLNVIITEDAEVVILISTVPFSGVNLKAFDRMLLKTFCSCTSSNHVHWLFWSNTKLKWIFFSSA